MPNEEDNNLANLCDVDVLQKSEENIILGFVENTVAFLNMRTKEFHSVSRFEDATRAGANASVSKSHKKLIL